MSQKYIKSQNNNSHNAAYGKYYATAVYDNHFIGTEELADFIQQQASVKKPDGSVKQKYVNAITLLKDVVFDRLRHRRWR